MVFDMVIPTAAIRLFAIVRTVARYAERLATHDAAFRFIARLRVNVFRSIAGGRGESATPLTAAVVAILGGAGCHCRLQQTQTVVLSKLSDQPTRGVSTAGRSLRP